MLLLIVVKTGVGRQQSPLTLPIPILDSTCLLEIKMEDLAMVNLDSGQRSARSSFWTYNMIVHRRSLALSKDQNLAILICKCPAQTLDDSALVESCETKREKRNAGGGGSGTGLLGSGALCGAANRSAGDSGRICLHQRCGSQRRRRPSRSTRAGSYQCVPGPLGTTVTLQTG